MGKTNNCCLWGRPGPVTPEKEALPEGRSQEDEGGRTGGDCGCGSGKMGEGESGEEVSFGMKQQRPLMIE